jgi:hypothetical protein
MAILDRLDPAVEGRRECGRGRAVLEGDRLGRWGKAVQQKRFSLSRKEVLVQGRSRPVLVGT